MQHCTKAAKKLTVIELETEKNEKWQVRAREKRTERKVDRK